MQTSPATLPLSLQTFKNFAGLYPFYLTGHSNLTCRRLHFVDSTLVRLAMLDSVAVKKAALIGHIWGSLIALKQIDKAKATDKAFKVVSLTVDHHQMTEAPEETLLEISNFLR